MACLFERLMSVCYFFGGIDLIFLQTEHENLSRLFDCLFDVNLFFWAALMIFLQTEYEHFSRLFDWH